MPRLLLVDDNPSIHKIAETLLAASSIELVCVDSAAVALEKVDRGDHFDVALVDTSMAVMDGWGLLARLREIPATARMPIAMMAGVLDTVDPERVKAAPIQGFLKKPVELKNLGDRVLQLMETPVPEPEPEPEPPAPVFGEASPFATMPATRLEDLPEIRQPVSAAPEEDDLLELTEEDLYPGPEAAPKEETLDLEELDLESLQGISPLPEHLSVPSPLGSQEPVLELPSPELELPGLGIPAEELVEIPSLGSLPEVEALSLPEPETVPETPLAAEATSPEPSVLAPVVPVAEFDWSDDSESMLAAVEAPAPAESLSLPTEELDLLDVSIPEIAAEPSLPVPGLERALPVTEEQPFPGILEAEGPVAQVPLETVPESAAEAPAPTAEAVQAPAPAASLGTQELLEAMMADPVLMDALSKAVVARLGDQVLREIAWEVMPELAERLPRS